MEILQPIGLHWASESSNRSDMIHHRGVSGEGAPTLPTTILVSLQNHGPEIGHPWSWFTTSPVGLIREVFPRELLLRRIRVGFEEALSVDLGRKLGGLQQALFGRCKRGTPLKTPQHARHGQLKFPSQPVCHAPEGEVFNLIKG